jgi:hypothetical protein
MKREWGTGIGSSNSKHPIPFVCVSCLFHSVPIRSLQVYFLTPRSTNLCPEHHICEERVAEERAWGVQAEVVLRDLLHPSQTTQPPTAVVVEAARHSTDTAQK